MNRWIRISALSACVASALACDEQTEVQRQTRDLQEAQKNVARVTEQLESQLAEARADVVRLEEKVALARQGLTDDVLENQKELQAALKAQESKVETELGEAKREAQIHNRDSEAALKQLQSAPAPAAAEAPVGPGQSAEVTPVPSENPDRYDLVPVKGGPDPRSEGTVEMERGTPAPAAPPAAVTPNDPPAPAPTPAPPHTDLSPSNTPPGNAAPMGAAPSATPPSASPPNPSPGAPLPSDPPPVDTPPASP